MKKILMILIFVFLFQSFCYSEENELAELPKDNIYRLTKDTTIRIVVPKGWKLAKALTTEGLLTFLPPGMSPTFSPDRHTSGSFSILLKGCYDYDPELSFAKIHEFKNRENPQLLKNNVIDFAGGRANSVVYVSDSLLKGKKVFFCNDGVFYQFSMGVRPVEEYDKWAIDFEISLKTFKIIRQGERRNVLDNCPPQVGPLTEDSFLARYGRRGGFHSSWWKQAIRYELHIPEEKEGSMSSFSSEDLN